MRFAIGILLALVLATPAWAVSVRFGSRLVVVGDSIAKVLDVAGKPDRIVPVENKFGATVAERFEYYRGSKTISITVKEDHVIRVREID